MKNEYYKHETELTATVLKKDPKHKRLKERFLIEWNGTNVQIFEKVLFSSYIQHRNRKTNKLTLCQLDVGGWRKEKGMRLTKLVRLSQSHAIFLPPDSHHSKWHKISLIVCFYVVHSLKKRTSSKICMFVLFRPIKKQSFNLLCVLDLLQTWRNNWLQTCPAITSQCFMTTQNGQQQQQKQRLEQWHWSLVT